MTQIETACPNCLTKMKAPSAYLSKSARCANCQHIFTIEEFRKPIAVAPPPVPNGTIRADSIGTAISNPTTPRPEAPANSYSKWTIGDTLIRLLGLAIVVLTGVWFAIQLSNGYGSRFKSDNAIGATANATEATWVNSVFWLNFFGGLSLFSYASLRRIRRKFLEE